MRDFRDSPWFYPVMFDVAVLLPAALTLALDPTQPGPLRWTAPGAFLVINVIALTLVFRRRHRARHAGSRQTR